MNIEVSVRVADVLQRLGIEALPEGSRWKPSDTVELAGIVDNDDAFTALPSSYTERELRDELDETDVQKLAEAIRCGDTSEAELMLDRIARSDDAVTEWIQRGRYSRRARTSRPVRAALKAA